MDVQELDRMVDEILSKAEEERERIISEAKRRAAELLNRPIPVEEYRREAELIIAKAKEEAERILKDAMEKAEEMRRKASPNIDKAVALLLEYVLGLRRE